MFTTHGSLFKTHFNNVNGQGIINVFKIVLECVFYYKQNCDKFSIKSEDFYYIHLLTELADEDFTCTLNIFLLQSSVSLNEQL